MIATHGTELVLTVEDVRRLLPCRPVDLHKGGRGRLLIVGGSEHYPGAPALSALGALRTGTGVVTLLSLPCVCAACAARLPEVVYRPLEERGEWLDTVLEEASSYAAAVVGPGLDRSEEAQNFAVEMWKLWPQDKPLLLDGDGLFALSEKKPAPRENAVLTPHEGEAARLLGATATAMREDRGGAVAELAERWGGVALLKGHGTLVARRGGEKVCCLGWGGPELAVPGSGDVLSGCVGALLASGISPLDAALVGGALHGMAGDRLRGRHGVDGVLASEIADELRAVLRDLREERA